MNRSKTFVEDGAWLYKGFVFFFRGFGHKNVKPVIHSLRHIRN